jgi:pSer/pThr/pTyr-binding forkhead associated (FHA) protein
VGLKDIFRRGGGGPSRAGVRRGRGSGERRADERTENIRARTPDAGAYPPAPPASPHRTVVMPRAPQPPAYAPPPVSAPPPHEVSPPGDSEKTIYETVAPRRGGKIVGVLVGVDGPLEGRLFPVLDGENLIGRGEHCRISIPREDRRISREHAKVIHREGVFVVQPLKDKAVTRVNDEPTTGSELSHGDSLTLGDSTFRFVSVY